jgi:CubicO group peptidase (beta-lactamase class C family)
MPPGAEVVMSSFKSGILSAVRAPVAAGLCCVVCACATRAADPQQAASRIDSLLSREYPPDDPGAAVLVSRGGTVILKKGYGLANTERKVPVTSETVFRLASVTKMFTATAILMLAEKNQLVLDDPVVSILPASPVSGQITVRHLLSHTAGLADYLDRPDSMAWARSEHTVQDLVSAFKDKRSPFAPGEKNAYSNSNYVLLGAIIEKVSGISFGRFVKANIFGPLNMTSTSCEGRFEDIPGLATAYEPARTSDDQLDWSRLLVARPYTMSALYSAGGCVSSIEDLARFHEGLFRGGIVGRRVLSESLEPARLNNGGAGTMSLGGWQLDTVAGHRAAMSGGALPGVCTWFLTMPDEDVVVILLSNRTPGKPRCGMLAVQIAGIVAGE